VAEKVSKQFFFEKKNQKTFDPLGRAVATPRLQKRKSFLLLFFQKEVLLSFLPTQPDSHHRHRPRP
jgi:hypothetical protein